MQRALMIFLAGLLFVSFFGCLQTTAQDKAGANLTREKMNIDAEELPTIEDSPLTSEDAILEIENY